MTDRETLSHAIYIIGEVPQPCPICHGRGTVYPPELVERIKFVLQDTKRHLPVPERRSTASAIDLPLSYYEAVAVAVLDTLNDFAADKLGRET